MGTMPPPSSIFDGRRQGLVQAGLVACCAATAAVFGGSGAGLGALFGGLAAMTGTLAFLGVFRWRSQPAPTAAEAFRALLLAEAAKWAVSLGGLAALLSGSSGSTAASESPAAVVIGFCVAWAAPWLALMKRS